MHNHFHAHGADTDGRLVDKHGADAHTRTQTTVCQKNHQKFGCGLASQMEMSRRREGVVHHT